MQKSGYYNQGKIAGEVKANVSHKKLLQKITAEICTAKHYNKILECECGSRNMSPLPPSHSISCGLKLGSLPWPGGSPCLFLTYTQPSSHVPFCLHSSQGGSTMLSLPGVGCVMDVTTGRGQAQGDTEGATPQYPFLARAQQELQLWCTSWVFLESISKWTLK